jgi:DNA repair protein RadC
MFAIASSATRRSSAARSIAVEPREILKKCLLRGAAGVMIYHTHPSGDPTPSDADMQFTRRMAYAAALVGVDLVDHLVLGAIGR